MFCSAVPQGQKIGLAIDFPEHCKATLQWAGREFRALGKHDSIFVIHVRRSPPNTAPYLRLSVDFAEIDKILPVENENWEMVKERVWTIWRNRVAIGVTACVYECADPALALQAAIGEYGLNTLVIATVANQDSGFINSMQVVGQLQHDRMIRLYPNTEIRFPQAGQ